MPLNWERGALPAREGEVGEGREKGKKNCFRAFGVPHIHCNGLGIWDFGAGVWGGKILFVVRRERKRFGRNDLL